MIAIFPDAKAAQRYCDERSAAHGCPVTGTHPRTGKPVVLMAAWCGPVKHPTKDQYRVALDERGPAPEGAEIAHVLGEDWDRYSPIVAADRADQETAARLAKTESDVFAMTILLEKITPEQAAEAASANPDETMQFALMQKEHEVYLWLKNRKS